MGRNLQIGRELADQRRDTESIDMARVDADSFARVLDHEPLMRGHAPAASLPAILRRADRGSARRHIHLPTRAFRSRVRLALQREDPLGFWAHDFARRAQISALASRGPGPLVMTFV